MLKKVALTFDVPDDMSNSEISELIDNLLNIGLKDAEDTLLSLSREEDNPEAERAVLIDLRKIEVLN